MNCIKMSERENEREREVAHSLAELGEETINFLHPIKQGFKSISTLE